MQDPTTPRPLQRKRGRLKRGVLYALAIVLPGCAFGFVDSLAERAALKPAYHRLLFTELARQNFLMSGTSTIVKENESALALFETEYNRRNAKLGFPPGRAYVPDNAVLQFSYIPAMIEQFGPGLTEIPGSKLVKENARPVIWEDEPGTHPMLVWVYSKRESLLACFVYQLLTTDHPLFLHPPHPDPRMIEPIDWNGVVSVQGAIPNVRVFPEHAYLVPLGDLKLENLDRRATDMPQLFVLQHALPIVMSPGHDPTNASVPNAGETIVLLRVQAARPFILTRRVFRFLVLPLGLVWLAACLWRMRRLHLQFTRQIGELATTGATRHEVSFAAFLTSDLDAKITSAMTEAKAFQDQMLAAERVRAEINDLRAELQRYVLENQPSNDEADRINRALSSESLPELRSLVAHYRQRIERELQIAREQQREIQWLESEFESVPPIKRHNEAREAWQLYEQAITAADPRTKLYWLKEARKKLPKDLKAE